MPFRSRRQLSQGFSLLWRLSVADLVIAPLSLSRLFLSNFPSLMERETEGKSFISEDKYKSCSATYFITAITLTHLFSWRLSVGDLAIAPTFEGHFLQTFHFGKGISRENIYPWRKNYSCFSTYFIPSITLTQHSFLNAFGRRPCHCSGFKLK